MSIQNNELIKASDFDFLTGKDTAGFHNSIYRGKYLGDGLTSNQLAYISQGTFNDMYIGDYWTINSINYRIAHFDYYRRTYNTIYPHHITIVPDSIIGSVVKFNNSATSTSGYYNSNLRSVLDSTTLPVIKAAFGEENILAHYMHLPYQVQNVGATYDSKFYNVSIHVMNEINVFGCRINGDSHNTSTNAQNFPVLATLDHTQYALFKLDHSRITADGPSGGAAYSDYWLRDLAFYYQNIFRFCRVDAQGYVGYTAADLTSGIRPAFEIYAGA